MKVAFTGTRHGCTPGQLAALRALLGILPATEFHHGNCIGADAQAHDIMVGRVETNVWPSTNPNTQAGCVGYKHYPRGPPLDRNKDIVNGAMLLVACPNAMYAEQRSGTWHAIRYALKIGVPVTVVWPNGVITQNYFITEDSYRG